MRTIALWFVASICSLSALHALAADHQGVRDILQRPPDALLIRIAVPQQDAVVVRDDRSHFDVVIENVSREPQKIIDEWNSWGYFTLRLEYTTAAGEKKVAKKVGREWTKNFFTATTLKPGEVMVREVYLDKAIWSDLPVPERGDATVTMRAVLTQQDPTADAWHGQVSSTPQQVTFRNQS